MNKKIYFLLIVLLALSFNLKAQTAQIGDTTAIPGDPVSFDITVAGFPTDVAAISLFIGYDPNVLTYVDATDGTISGYITNNMTGTNQVGLQWTNTSGQAIDGVLVTLNFIYSNLGGSCNLTWGSGCEWTELDFTTITVTYTEGSVGPESTVATIDLGDTITAPDPIVPVSLPMVASGFPTNVGAITLYISYDDDVLTYAGTTPGVLTGYAANAFSGTIGITWYNTSGASINGTMLNLNFIYNGGTCVMPFITGCEIVEVDFDPIIVSYGPGSISPLATAYTMTLDNVTAVPGPNPIDFHITASGYPGNIGAIDLYIGFDPDCLAYYGLVSGLISGAIGNVVSPGLLHIVWTNPGGQPINGPSFLLAIQFIYGAGQCPVTFEPGCQITDILLNNYATTFFDGSVIQGVGTAQAEMKKQVGVIGQPISFPILVSNFPVNVGAVSLFIGFNPSVLQYTGTTPGTLTGYFANLLPSGNKIGIQWSDFLGNNISPFGGDTLLMLNFIYWGGTCPLTFSMGCEFAENDLDPISVAYYDGAVIHGTKLDVKAFLMGPWNGTVMDTSLNLLGYLPTAQPYNTWPYNYTGSDSVSSIPTTDVVDWVLLELRETIGGAANATAGTMVGRTAALILKDGTITGLDGINEVLVNLAINDELYVVIWHRNHINMMSANQLTFTNVDGYDVYSYDFTDNIAKAYGSGQAPLSGGVYGMISADGYQDGIIDILDYYNFWVAEFGFNGYYGGDYTLDGIVDILDYYQWVINFGQNTMVP